MACSYQLSAGPEILRQILRVFCELDSFMPSSNDSDRWQKDFAFGLGNSFVTEAFQWSAQLLEKWPESSWAMSD